MIDKSGAQPRLRRIRFLLWTLVGLALAAICATYLVSQSRSREGVVDNPVHRRFGGPFTLTGSDGKPFSINALAGKPYAIYFGFTRCADTCPTTLSRMVKLRSELKDGEELAIVFVTIDPEHDGPREVGQYTSLFNAPIIGLTGTPAQIDRVKKQYGIFAQPTPNAPMGKEMEHSAVVLLFDRHGQFSGVISPNDSDAVALKMLRGLND